MNIVSALAVGDLEGVRKLINKDNINAPINQVRRILSHCMQNEDRPLHYAAYHYHDNGVIYNLLIENGADDSKKNKVRTN